MTEMTFKKNYFMLVLFIRSIKRLAIVGLSIEKGGFHGFLANKVFEILLQMTKARLASLCHLQFRD